MFGNSLGFVVLDGWLCSADSQFSHSWYG